MDTTKEIIGDAIVDRSLTVGYNTRIGGGLTVGHNVRVEGWLDAPNIKGPSKGLFASAEALKVAYPKPAPGWFALVGDSLPADIWTVSEGRWVATGKRGGEPVVALNRLEERMEQVEERMGTKIGFQAPYAYEDGKVVDRGFASREDYMRWLANPGGYAGLVISERIVPVTANRPGGDLYMEIDMGGDPFIAWGETKKVRCRVLRGWEDVTSKVTRWEVTRDSGGEDEDSLWVYKPKVQNFRGEISICFTETENDLGRYRGIGCVGFMFKAILEDGDEAVAELNI